MLTRTFRGRSATRIAAGVSGQAVAAALALAGFAAPAFAQDNAPAAAQDDQQAIVVTGFRAALATSVATKRNSNQIVESISAEDIGKLPDNSIAEAIARLPGLTAQRLDGRAQMISIRGLAPDFSATLLNGREQVTTGDNRGVEFDQYPSELMGAVDVYKTPYAGLIGQGLSGTVNLRTIRPLDYGKRVLAVNGRGEIVSPGKLNAGTRDKGWRVSATYVDQFADDTIGVTLGIAHLDSPTQFEKFNAWGYPTFSTDNDTYGIRDTHGTPDPSDDTFTPRPGYAQTRGALVIGGAKPYVQSNELQRTGAMGTIEFRPDPSLKILLDGYYSHFRDKQTLRGIEFPLAWGNAVLAPGATVRDGIITDGTWTNVKGVVRNDGNLRVADLYSAGANVTYDAGGWKFEGDVSYSRVDREDKVLETYAGTSRGAGNGPFDTLRFSANGPVNTYRFDPTLDYANAGTILLTSPQGWGGDNTPGGQDGFLNNPTIKDELLSFRGSVRRELGENAGRVEFGANYTSRDKNLDLKRFYLGLKANAADPLHNTSVPIPRDYLLGPTKLAYLGIPGMVSYDPFALAYSGIYNFNAATNADLYAFGWSVSEDVLTGYARYDIDAEVGEGKTLSGNVGLQVVRVDQSSNGLAASGSPVAVVTDVSDSVSYTHLLPSMNLVARFGDGFVVRFGAARQMARPRMDQMRASINFSYDSSRAGSTSINFSPWSGSGGSPRLRPWLANSVDLSVEKYFGRDSYVALSGYYKYLETYIYQQSRIYDFSGFPVTSGPQPALRQGIVNIFQNGKGGQLYGAEASFAFSLGNALRFLDGFGVLGSVSYTESSITPDPSNPAQPLPGLSNWVASGTVYFEKNGFSARASVRNRSSFLAELSGVGTDRIQRMARGETVVDAQIGYEFQKGALQGLGVLFQAQNLTNEPFSTRDLSDERLTIDYQRYGVRYLLGVSYRLW